MSTEGIKLLNLYTKHKSGVLECLKTYNKQSERWRGHEHWVLRTTKYIAQEKISKAVVWFFNVITNNCGAEGAFGAAIKIQLRKSVYNKKKCGASGLAQKVTANNRGAGVDMFWEYVKLNNSQ